MCQFIKESKGDKAFEIEERYNYLKEDIAFLKIYDYSGFLKDGKCQNSKATTKFENLAQEVLDN